VLHKQQWGGVFFWFCSGPSLDSQQGQEFPFSTMSRPVLGPTQPPIQQVLGALSPGVKRSGREAEIQPDLQRDGVVKSRQA
jgi:hypothetical protein